MFTDLYLAMENDNFVRWNVPDLKTFLQQRGITCHIYRKHDLVRLCSLARELNLECVNQDDSASYVDFNISRRTVEENGTQKTLCDLSSIQSWSDDLKGMPNLQHFDILLYLLKKCEWSEERLKGYKRDNGFLMFSAGHIDNVSIAEISGTRFMYIKSSCVPETRQHDTAYTVWVLIDGEGSIYSGGCSCVADNGTCKHCVALLFAVANFCDRHKDRNTEVGTDIACKWDKPRKTSEPMEIDNIDIRIHKKCDVPSLPTFDNYKPIENIDIATQRNIEKNVYKLCTGTGAVLLETLDPPSDESDIESEALPQTLSEIAESVKCDTNSDFDHDAYQLQSKIKTVHDQHTIVLIEEMTRGQAANTDWFRYREGRITASIFSSVLHFRFTDETDNYILKKVMNDSTIFKSSAMKFGIENEPVARCLYTDLYSKTHKQVSVRQCGLCIYKECPIIGASPDGIVTCKCCGKGLLEIKCSSKYQNSTPAEVCEDDDYHLYLDENNSVRLKIESPWYIQIQGQLGVCGLNWCDFVFYTKKGITVERILFDCNLFRSIVDKSKTFFEKYVCRALIR